MKIDSRYITPYFSSHMRDNDAYMEKTNPYSEGDILELKGVECDGFSMRTKRYKLVKYIDSINNVDVDAVILKELDDCSNSTIFSLTKADCANLNIEFEPKLQIFPCNLNWKRVEEETEVSQSSDLFNPLDLSTYPMDYKTRKIKYMTIKISGCQELNYKIILLDRTCINKSDLLSLQICVKDTIGVACDLDNVFIPKGTILPYEFATTKFSRCEPNKKFVDANGCLFLEFAIYNRHYNVIGVEPSLFKNKMFSDVFEVSIVVQNEKNNLQQILNTQNSRYSRYKWDYDYCGFVYD